jgi:hypothetical protein
MNFSFADFLKNPSDLIFCISAIVGTTLFALRIVMSIFGDMLSVDDSDIELFEEEHSHHEQSSFKILSLHSISGFFMMFGLVGLGCSNQLGFSPLESFGFAFGAGVAIMFVTALIFHGAAYFKSSGDVFSIQKTLGVIGTVYQAIPSEGQGKIQLLVNGMTREVLAQSRDNVPIASFTSVKVTRVIDHEIVEVIKL